MSKFTTLAALAVYAVALYAFASNWKRVYPYALMHIQYLRYIIRHKYFVFRSGLAVGGVPFYRLVIHDWSKFTPTEWFPYATHFYGPDRGTPNRKGSEVFVLGWHHHVHWNKHHWNYWALVGNSGVVKALQMPEIYVREMVADWMGAGRGIDGTYDPMTWFAKNEWKMELHSETRKRVNALLEEKPWLKIQ